MSLHAQDVAARYGSLPLVLDGVSCSVEQGRLLAVVGPNGSGKSTLVRAVSGLIRLERGEVRVKGEPLARWTRQALARVLAVVSQGEEVTFPLRVDETVMLGRYARLGALAAPGPADRAAVADAMARCDVAGLAGRTIDSLSGGEWQRVRLARALAQEPQALVLDEPTTSLDVRHEMELFELIRRLVDGGLAVMVITHHINLAARFTDRMILLSAGRVAAEGPPAEVLRREIIREVFGWPVAVTTWCDGSPRSSRSARTRYRMGDPRAGKARRAYFSAMARSTPSRRPVVRPGFLALAAGLTLGCADTNAPPPEPLELLLVVNRQSNSLSIIPVDGTEAPGAVALGGVGASATTVAAREGIALVPLGGADAVAVVDLVGRVLMSRIDLPAGSGATGAAMLNDSIGYVANPGLNTISRVNVFTGETAELPVGITPRGFAVARGRLFVLNANLDQTGEPSGSSWLTVINPATNSLATGIDSVPLTGPGNAAFATPAPDGFLYVVSRGRTTPAEGRLSVVDPLERREVASFAGLGLQPGQLASDGGSRLFVSSLSEGLLEFNTDSNAVIRGEADGIPIATNTGVAVDSKGRVYAIEAGGCAPGQPGVAHVLDEELEEIDRITLGRCPAAAIVIRIGQEPGQDF